MISFVYPRPTLIKISCVHCATSLKKNCYLNRICKRDDVFKSCKFYLRLLKCDVQQTSFYILPFLKKYYNMQNS